MLTVQFITGKGYKLKSAKGRKKHRVYEKYQMQSFCFPLPVKSGCITLQVLTCDDMHRVLPIGNLSHASVFRVFILHSLD